MITVVGSSLCEIVVEEFLDLILENLGQRIHP